MSEKQKVEHPALAPGQEFRARYKKRQYTAVVRDDNLIHVTGPEGEDLGSYKSLSMAGRAVTGGSVNGWRFWSLAEEGAEAEQPTPAATPAPKAKATKKSRKRAS